jgi:hypothetical protein
MILLLGIVARARMRVCMLASNGAAAREAVDVVVGVAAGSAVGSAPAGRRSEKQTSLDKGVDFNGHGCCTKHSPVPRSQAGCALSTKDDTFTLAPAIVSSVLGSTRPQLDVSMVSQSCPAIGRRFTPGFR